MSNRSLIAGLIVIVVVAASYLFVFTDSSPDSPSDGASSQSLPSYNLAEVAQHDSDDDCWTTIDGNVYDITAYISVHPGGDEIERACGADGSRLFNQRTDSDGDPVGSGTAHSASARSILDDYLIGRLSD